MIRLLPSLFGYAVALAVFLWLRRRRPLFVASILGFLAGVAACFGAPALPLLLAEGPDAVWLLLPLGVFLYAPTMLPLILLLPLLGYVLNRAGRP